jgi:excisionase family DNA binding protein
MANTAMVVTVTEAAELLGISRSLAYDLARTGQLPALRLGRRLVIPITALLSLLEQSNTPVA